MIIQKENAYINLVSCERLRKRDYYLLAILTMPTGMKLIAYNTT